MLVETEKPGEDIAKVVSLIAENVNMNDRVQKGVFGNFQRYVIYTSNFLFFFSFFFFFPFRFFSLLLSLHGI
mgnify:CR=1 FL=1